MSIFQLDHVDARTGARRGKLHTPHGTVDTPAFMPVGTQGTVKGLTSDMLRATGTQMVLANTYHLALRPGADVVAQLGGLHRLMNWDGPILTDSGGFQIFSLAQLTRVDEQAARFRSHIDGRLIELSPERAMEIQRQLGSDIAMVLDHVTPLPAPPDVVREACERTVRWAERCLHVAERGGQLLFAIVQGGLDVELRIWCARQLIAMGFDGYAIGGLSVGETVEEMYRVVEAICPHLPEERPRYLMGVGRPEDILQAVRRGVDLFDCVIPTRNGRNALAFTDDGPLRMRNLVHQTDPRPIEADCPCPACRYSRGFIRHLFMADEMLGPILLSAHNVTYYQRLMAQIRSAIEQDAYDEFMQQKLRRWAGSQVG